MNSKLLLILPVLSVLTLTPAFGDATNFDLHQGTATCSSPDRNTPDETATDECPPRASAYLEWCIEYQDGTECGESQRFLTTFTEIPFTFFDSNMIRTLIHAEVSPKTDYSQMPDIYCIQEPSWTSRQTITVNGIEMDLPKQFNTGDTYDFVTQTHTGNPLQFTPSLVERLLDQNGIQLNNGDEFVWTTHWNSGHFVVEGQLDDPDGDGTGSCIEKDDSHNIAVGFDAVTVGLSSQMTFIWHDPQDLITTTDPNAFDTDNDGIPDSQDVCDFSPEVFNGFQDTDGCPDEVNTANDSALADSDGDGIPDNADLCDLEQETVNGVDDTDGCPDFLEVPQPEPVGDDPTTPVHVDVTQDEPDVDNGITEYCNNATVDNCEQILNDVVENVQREGTGIKLPFEPNLINMIIIFGIISAVVVFAMRMKKK